MLASRKCIYVYNCLCKTARLWADDIYVYLNKTISCDGDCCYRLVCIVHCFTNSVERWCLWDFCFQGDYASDDNTPDYVYGAVILLSHHYENSPCSLEES